eukprot:366387-Chlamydomonas_euryale.AAC.26
MAPSSTWRQRLFHLIVQLDSCAAASRSLTAALEDPATGTAPVQHSGIVQQRLQNVREKSPFACSRVPGSQQYNAWSKVNAIGSVPPGKGAPLHTVQRCDLFVCGIPVYRDPNSVVPVPSVSLAWLYARRILKRTAAARHAEQSGVTATAAAGCEQQQRQQQEQLPGQLPPSVGTKTSDADSRDEMALILETLSKLSKPLETRETIFD